MLTNFFAIALIGLMIDALLGDPDLIWRRVPHPVVLMGRLIAGFDRWFNRPGWSADWRRGAGWVGVIIGAIGCYWLGWLLDLLLFLTPFSFIPEAIVLAVLIAHRSLVQHIRAVGAALAGRAPANDTKEARLKAGRRAVSRVVGRRTGALDAAGVTRAAIESAAENFSDGVVAPVFWYLVLGLPGALVYKFINTADSMIGHKTRKYRAFGEGAARLDDLANFIPARLSALLLVAGGALTSPVRAAAAFRTLRADHGKTRSPNAGWPEAAMAGLLGLALGGPRRYQGEMHGSGQDEAWLNPAAPRQAVPADIRRAIVILWLAWGVFASALLIAAWGWSRLF